MRLIIIASALVAGSAAVSADAPVTMSADEAFASRKAAMFLSGALVSTVRQSVESGASVTDQAFAAGAINRWARTLPALFPAGSDVAGSRASPKIWSDRAGFEAKAKDYADAAEVLFDVAGSGDKDAFLAQLVSTREKCNACHDAYRMKDPKPPAAP